MIRCVSFTDTQLTMPVLGTASPQKVRLSTGGVIETMDRRHLCKKQIKPQIKTYILTTRNMIPIYLDLKREKRKVFSVITKQSTNMASGAETRI